MPTITDNAVPAKGRTSDEMIAFVIMTVLLAVVPLTGLYPYFVVQALCFALFACAFNLLIGYGGLLSFGQQAFVGIGAYCLVLLTLGRYALRSLRRTEQKQPPLPSFIWIPAGLFQGFLGALLLFTLPPSSAPPWTYGLARQLAQQGLILSLVLGLAPMLAPMLWTGNAPPPPRHAAAQRALQAGCAVALVASFVLEQVVSIPAGLLLRGVICAALLWRVTLPWQPRRRAGLHRVLFRVALWLIPVGFLCAAATPLHRVACLHITFVAGLMALTFATSVHVTLLHSGHEAEAERSSPAVATTVLLLYLAAALRVGADWLGIYFLDGLTAAAGLALLGLLLWAVFLLLKLRRP